LKLLIIGAPSPFVSDSLEINLKRSKYLKYLGYGETKGQLWIPSEIHLHPMHTVTTSPPLQMCTSHEKSSSCQNNIFLNTENCSLTFHHGEEGEQHSQCLLIYYPIKVVILHQSFPTSTTMELCERVFAK
jgi:hypothetical protein